MTIDYRRHFEEHAGHYSEQVAPLFAVTHRHLASWAAGLPPTRVLDVACGDGRVAAAIAEHGHEVIACDRSAPLVHRAGRARVHALIADAHALPLRDGSVGAVVCNLGLQFFDQPVVALREMARVVERGKPVIITIPDKSVGAVVPAAPPPTEALAAAGLAIVAEQTLAEQVHLHDVSAIVAVWRVELGTRHELAEVSDEELFDLAGVLVQRAGGGVGVSLGFRVYSCTAG
ncbi:class I SAM-dependent methyltransferase [Actinosynnema sp. NPDC023794]